MREWRALWFVAACWSAVSAWAGPPDDVAGAVADEADEADEVEQALTTPTSTPQTPGSATPFDKWQAAQPQRLTIASGRTTVASETNLTVPEYGAFPLPVFIDNSKGPRQLIRLAFRSNTLGAPRTVTRDVEVAAGERRTVSLVLYAQMRNGMLEAHGAGFTEDTPKPLYFATAYAPGRSVLVLGTQERFEAFVGRKPAYSGANVITFAMDAAAAPVETMAYSGFSAVVLPDEGALDALNEAQREALERMTVLGGSLIVRGPLRASSSFPLLAQKPAVGEALAYGLGTITVTDPAGFRAARVSWADRPVLPNDSSSRYVNGRSWDALLPQATVPVGRFMLIITLFTLLIGPGSVWVSRRRGPATLLLSIPATAFATCVLIIGYSLVADGFTVHGAVFGYTRLDRARNRATTFGLSAFYANLGPGSVRFDATSVLVPPTTDNEREQLTTSLEWRDGLRAGPEYLPSRVYREWGLAEVTPTRARLVVKRSGNGWVVQNALGARLREVDVNVGGVPLSAYDVGDGAEAPLSPSPCGPAWESCRPHAIDDRVENRFSARVRGAFIDAPVPPGEFAAYLDGQGFVPTGGVALELAASHHLVRGEYTP